MIALQRSVGNASTLALMRRAHVPPLALTIPEVVVGAVAETYSLEYDGNHKLVGLNITRPTDADSPRLAKASTNGPPNVTATFLVRGPRALTITMVNCMVSSFVAHGAYDSVQLRFSNAHLDYAGESE